MLALVAGCARLTPEQQLVREAANALGGDAALRQAAVLTLTGTGRQFNLGQDMRPGLAGQTFTVSDYRRDYDLAAPRWRVTQTRTPNFTYFQGPQAQTAVLGVDGDVAYAGVTPTRASAATANERRAERFHHPLVLLRAALAEGAQVRLMGRVPPDLVSTGAQQLAIETPDGQMVLTVDGQKLPVRIASQGTHPNLGDVTLTTAFADYVAVGALRLPTRITTQVDDFTTGEYHVTSQIGATTDLAAPAQAAGATAPGVPAVNVAVRELARGVWLLGGQSHHSALVAFADRLVLLEVPQSEARSLAVIATARTLAPATPLTHVVVSHHHFDHSAGLRAAIAEGLTVVTHEGNEAFVREMAERPFTRRPDALARRPRAVTIEPVGAVQTIVDRQRRLELHHLDGNPHSDTLLMAYLPAERIVIQADAFSPGGSYHPYAENLLAHIGRLKLRVDRVVPLHGDPLTYAEMVAAVRPKP